MKRLELIIGTSNHQDVSAPDMKLAGIKLCTPSILLFTESPKGVPLVDKICSRVPELNSTDSLVSLPGVCLTLLELAAAMSGP